MNINRRFRTPVFQSFVDYVEAEDPIEAAVSTTLALRYITRESDFRKTLCRLVDGIEARSEAKRLVVCNYDIVVRFKLAVMECLQRNISSLGDTRQIFEDHGLSRDDAWAFVNAHALAHPSLERIRKAINGITLPSPNIVEKNAHAWLFDGTVTRSIRGLVRKKLSFVAGNYNVTLQDLEMDVLAAALEGFYLTIPFSCSEQHAKASAVATAKNKINKIISYHQTHKRRQISRDDETGNFSNSMLSLSYMTDDGVDIGENMLFSLMGAEEDPMHNVIDMRASLASLRAKERDIKRRKAMRLLSGEGCAKLLRTQAKSPSARFKSYEEAIDEVGPLKYFTMVRQYVGMSANDFDDMLTMIRNAA